MRSARKWLPTPKPSVPLKHHPAVLGPEAPSWLHLYREATSGAGIPTKKPGYAPASVALTTFDEFLKTFGTLFGKRLTPFRHQHGMKRSALGK